MRTETSLCHQHVGVRSYTPSTMTSPTADFTGDEVFPEGVLEGTDPDKAMEWNELEITFTWEAGEPALNTGTVTVSYHPVTDDLTKMIPRYASGPTNDVITIEDCTTTLLFPFVTNQGGFDTGLAITNASEGAGVCTIDYSGPDAPDDMMTPESLAGGTQWIDLVSSYCPRIHGLCDCNL